jgi:carbon storage regulator
LKRESRVLVLTRKAKEKIVIDGKIVITILKIQDRAVSVGVEAPSDVKIYREELTSAHPLSPVEPEVVTQ